MKDKKKIICPMCSGNGRIECSDCGGTGKETCPNCFGTGTLSWGRQCIRCGSTGLVKGTCYYCDGKGVVDCPLCKRTGYVVPSKKAGFAFGKIISNKHIGCFVILVIIGGCVYFTGDNKETDNNVSKYNAVQKVKKNQSDIFVLSKVDTDFLQAGYKKGIVANVKAVSQINRIVNYIVNNPSINIF
jgi:hypothetical protein